MNLHSLRIFYEVAQYNSISQAATNLYISQPAVSQQIKKLESYYQVQLITKKGRGIALTTLGQAVYEEAQAIFRQEAVIEELLTAGNRDNLIRIAGTQLAIDQFAKESLMTYQNKAVNIRLQNLNTDQTIALMRQQDLDFGIIPKKVDLVNFERQILYQDEWVFVAHTDYTNKKITLDQVRKAALIIREAGSSTYQQLLAVFDNNDNLGHSIEVNNHRDALQLALSGQGIYFCSYVSVKEFVENNQLMILEVWDYSPAKRDIYLYTNKNTRKYDFIRAFEQHLIDVV